MALKRTHRKLLDEFHFDHWGELDGAMQKDEYDGCRVVYAITNPTKTEVVYVGDTEQGRDVRARLRAHLNARDKAGLVEKTSDVYIHMMVTEFAVLDAFEQDDGAIPALNKRKSQKHV